jgi:hypothetical protein
MSAPVAYVVTLQPERGRDGIRDLRFLLKVARRHLHMRALDVRELSSIQLRAPTMPPAARELQSGRTKTETETETETEEFEMVTKSEAFPSKYISAADLPKPIVREIIETNVEMLKTRDGVSSKKLTVYFRGMSKALVCNSTNFDSIAEITGEFDSDNWPGHEIELFKDTTSMGGKVVDCVRVRKPGSAKKTAATKAKELVVESENPEPVEDF